MTDNPIGADDARILVYARLIDPEVWPEDGDPEVTTATSHRLIRSMEAAYRIACHEGGVSDPTDVVARLTHALGLAGAPVSMALPEGMGLDEAQDLVAILLGEMHGAGERADVPSPGYAEAGDIAAPEPEPEPDPSEEDGTPPDEDEPDPDHDPEAGISHVGDADAGQYHEEP